MADLTLSIASLRAHHACELDARIADLRRVLPEVTDDQPVPLRVWWDLPTTSVPDRLWSLRAVEPQLSAQILGVRTACLAARRVLHLTRNQNHSIYKTAIAAAERWADNPCEETMAAADAAYAAARAAARAADADADDDDDERNHQRADLDRLLDNGDDGWLYGGLDGAKAAADTAILADGWVLASGGEAVTPRERAEALGWVREEFRCQPFWRQPGVLLYWSPADAEWVMDCWPSCDIGFPTEDEALAHALLLRDVVLS